MSWAAMFGRRIGGHGLRFDRSVIDERTDRELQARYYRGEISIGTYLDWRFGTSFNAGFSAGERPAAG